MSRLVSPKGKQQGTYTLWVSTFLLVSICPRESSSLFGFWLPKVWANKKENQEKKKENWKRQHKPSEELLTFDTIDIYDTKGK